MTLRDNLSNLESEKKLTRIPANKEEVEKIFKKAINAYKFSEATINSAFKDTYDYDNRIFLNTYDALKFGFISLLRLYEYKTKSTGGNYLIFSLGKDILIEEFKKNNRDKEKLDNIKNTIRRIDKIVEKRNDDLYTPIISIISRTDLTTLITDTKFLLDKTGEVIENYK